MILVDTWTWIEILRGTKTSEKALEILKQEACVYTSIISIAEISRWAKVNGLDVDHIIEKISDRTNYLELELFILKISGEKHVELRKIKKTIGIIDVIIYTSALVHGMNVLTGDSDFEGLQGVIFLK